MKKLASLALGVLIAAGAMAQEGQTTAPAADEGFKFTTVKANPITSVKNQHRSSTCWSFAGIGLLEAEALRMGKGEVDLSEMFVVHHSMQDRAVNYVRLHGSSSFAPGGSFADVIYCLEHYGLATQEAMPGIMYGDSLPVHNELDAVAKGFVDAVAKGGYKRLTSVWRDALRGIYDAYLGACPDAEMTVGEKKTTPKEYAASLGLEAGNYVSLTSFTHHPFYTEFPIEVEDNWRQALSYNLPLDELMQVMRNAIDNGYTIGWAADVSELGFNRDGIAVMPAEARGADLAGSDMAKWTGMTEVDQKAKLTRGPLPEVEVTQEMRQEAFDNWQTTDDHGMLIYGIAADQNGKSYFMVKNSWGTKSKYRGTWYASEAFARYKTMNIVIHKDAIPKAIAKKLGIK